MEAVFHAPFNAALLHAVLLAYPDVAVSFRAFPEHAREVRGILAEQAPELAARVEWRVVPFAAGGSVVRRWRQCGQAIREVLGRSPNRSPNWSPERRERVLFCSLSRMQLLALKRAMRRTDQVRAVLHGDLDQLERPPRERFPMRLFALERVLQRPHPAGLRYLLLGDSIRERVPARLRAALANPGVIDHPYHFFPVRAGARGARLPAAPVFGIFGNSGSGRHLEAVARAVKAVDPTIRFRLVGFVANQAAVERLRPFVEDVGYQPIARATFLKRAEEITHALWLAPPNSFRLRASGTFFDALAYAKPLIYTANPYIDDYFDRAPGLGTRCATTAAVPQAILEAAAGHSEAAYGVQRAAIERLRERFSPAALAGTLPAALAWD
ncbi:MAG: glycosyltransferase family protein [Solirubrobacteraceae bacterium]